MCSMNFLNLKLFQLFSDLISVCGPGQYFYGGNQCLDCPVGTYQDSTFHRETMCKNCSGTQMGFILQKIYLKLQTHLDKYLSQRVSDFNTSLVSCKKTSSWEVQPMEQVLLLLQNAVSGSLIFFFVFLPLACVVFGNVITRRHFS